MTTTTPRHPLHAEHKSKLVSKANSLVTQMAFVAGQSIGTLMQIERDPDALLYFEQRGISDTRLRMVRESLMDLARCFYHDGGRKI